MWGLEFLRTARIETIRYDTILNKIFSSILTQLTMVSVVILNAATGVYQNSLYGLVAILPPRYTNAVILGNNISGTITTVVSIVSKLAVAGTSGEFSFSP